MFLDISSFIQTWQEYRGLCMKTYIHLLQYLAELFLEWETSQTNNYREN
jgi:hypothetical protein